MKRNQNKEPEWYWTLGLHDAKIVSVTTKESDWNPDDNYLSLKLNCKDALFETDIKEIRFFNFKTLTNDFDINLLNGGWWLSDELTEEDNCYMLELEFDTAECISETVKFTFKRAEVIRT